MNAKTAKSNMLTIFGSFLVLPLLLLVFVAPQVKMPMTPLTPVVALAGGGMSLYWCVARLLPNGKALEIAKFQTELLIALAGSELVVLAGVFMGSQPIGPWPFAAVAWFLMLGLMLPKVLRYWQIREQQEQGIL